MRSRRVLQRCGIAYVEIDIECVPGSEEEMRQINGGSGKVPTIVLETEAGKQILIEPSDKELFEAIETAEKAAEA
jgi:glutaredoxin